MDQLRFEHDVDVFVKKAFAQAVLGPGVPFHQREHLAHAAVVGRELIVKPA